MDDLKFEFLIFLTKKNYDKYINTKDKDGNFDFSLKMEKGRPKIEMMFFNKPNDIKIVGIVNQGNWCYLDSSLQLLIYMFNNSDTKSFYTDNIGMKSFIYLLNKYNITDDPSDENFKKLVKDFFFNFIKSRNSYLSKLWVKNFMKSGGYAQQDPTEFINEFLYMINNEITNNITGVDFNYQLEEIIYCDNCKNLKSKTDEIQSSLSLGINKEEMGSKYSDKEMISIIDALNNYFEGEILKDYTCEFCNKKGGQQRKYLMMKHPQYLFIYLKRFEVVKIKPANDDEYFLLITQGGIMDENGFIHVTKKIHDQIIINDQIKINDAQYSLVGKIQHDGDFANEGHYISFLKNKNKYKNKWFKIDDNYVSEYNFGQLSTDEKKSMLELDRRRNYILLYEINDKNMIPSYNDLSKLYLLPTLMNQFKNLK